MEPDRQPAPVRATEFVTSDGVRIVGDLAVPDTPRAAAIICHPHPQYGGDRHNNVVQALFRALAEIGVAALCFDFRTEFGGGTAELLDAGAALDHVAAAAPGLPVFATGYSFGALIALALDDQAVSGRVLVAPPLGAVDLPAGGDRPTLGITPEYDQFCPPDRAAAYVADWAHTSWAVIPSADHFLVGATGAVAAQATRWVTERLAG